jgi:CheY-specific phosphatase CheX
VIKVDYINPFIESVHNLFEMMLGTTVERGEPALLTKRVQTLVN